MTAVPSHPFPSPHHHRSKRKCWSLLVVCVVVLLTFPPLILCDVPRDTISPVPPPEGCTAIAVTRGASTVGPMTTHTNDCKDCDFRLSLVPSFPASSSHHPIAPSRFSYPRYVGPDRGRTLLPRYVDTRPYPWTATVPVGWLPSSPSSPRSFAYIDGDYAIQNEWGVSIGESTCAARLVSAPVYANGSALFDVSELTRVAMQRSRTAEEAVMVMGRLAEQFGYYGAEWVGDYARGEAGEGLTITDSSSAWVFHITPDDTGSSAVWAAQRVPDGHVAVLSNAFIIQQLNLSDTANFRASRNIFTVAERLGWWNRSSSLPFNFAAIYGSRVSFEVYCSRRTWRVFSLVAPSLAASLSPDAGVLSLPFSVPVDRRLSPADVFQLQRDHYENSSYDLTQGPAAGPFGNPNRYDRGEGGGLPMYVLMQGTFERPISMFRTSYSFVTESWGGGEEWRSKVWFSPAAPHASFYTPLWSWSDDVPVELGVGAGSLYSWQEGSAWWIVTAVQGWMEKAWCWISREVQRHQHGLETQQLAAVHSFERRLAELNHSSPRSLSPLLTRYQQEAAGNATQHWTRLFYHLITTYHDGYHVANLHAPDIDPTALFYPLAWLEDVGFWGQRGTGPDWTHKTWSYTEDYLPGFSNSTAVNKSAQGNQSGQGRWAQQSSGDGGSREEGGVSWTQAALMTVLALLVGLSGGAWLGRLYTLRETRSEYRPIGQE